MNNAQRAVFNNRFFRVFSIHTDEFGIDPLQDRILNQLDRITVYDTHEVTQSERGAPDLISFNRYGTEDYWWHIMAYNGICRFRDLTEGLTIKIPELASIVSLTTEVQLLDNQKIKTITI